MVRRSGDDFWAEWPMFMTRMRFSNVYEKEGALHAMLTVYIDMEGVPHPAEWTTINLIVANSRAAVANRLAENWMSAAPPYREMLREAAYWIGEQFEAGEPVKRLSPSLKANPIRHALWPILPRGLITSFYGDGGTAKSMFLLYFLLLIQEGIEHNGLRPLSNGAKVLYLDYECNWDEQQARIARIANGLGLGTYREMLYRECYRAIHRDIASIRSLADDENVDVIAVDSMGLAAGGDPKEASDTIRTLASLRELRRTVLVLDHVSKDGQQGKAIGSAFKFDYSRSAWETKKAEDTESDDLDVALIHRKANNGRLHAPLGFHITFEGDGEDEGPVTFRRVDIRDVPGLAGNASVTTRILHTLERGALSREQMQQAVNLVSEVKANTFTQTFSRLQKARRIVPVGNLWGLAAPSYQNQK